MITTNNWKNLGVIVSSDPDQHVQDEKRLAKSIESFRAQNKNLEEITMALAALVSPKVL